MIYKWVDEVNQAEALMDQMMQQKQYKRLDIIWLPRNPQRIRINIDGTVKRNPSLGDCGRVIRNNQEDGLVVLCVT